jgi:hypothetical protein
MTSGEDRPQTSALAIISMAAAEAAMDITTSTQSCLENSPLSTPSTLGSAGLKSRLNYRKEIGFGRPFGFSPSLMSTELGLQAGKSISWKVGEMWVILRNSEEDLKLSVQLCIGAPIRPRTNTQRPVDKNQ